MNGWVSFLVGSGVMMGVFALAWVSALRVNNYSWVDAIWAFGVGMLGWIWLGSVGGFGLKQVGAGVILGFWSLRLGWHLQRRIRRIHPEEDARYAALREVWAGREKSAFFWFFEMQAISVILLALPFWCIAVDSDRSWSGWECVGSIISFLGIAGEGIADWQMSRFKARGGGSKAVCTEGLWRYSRHPNYFFEAVIWVGFYVYACGSEWGWATIHAPVMIIFLLLKVTGIPPTEAAAVRRKGQAYRIYQQTTSSFIPWPPKPLISSNIVADEHDPH